MRVDTLSCLSECMEGTIFNDQKKLDTMYYLMQGLTYRQVAEKIEKQISYVQRVMDYLRNNGLLYWGRWSPNVYKIGMKKSIAFLNWENRNVPREKNYEYTTYAHLVQSEETRTMVIYTYPRGHESKIEGEIGEPITPFYYTYTHFTVPLFKKIDLVREFRDIFYSMESDQRILSGTPSFEEGTNTDPLTVYICMHAELRPDLTPGILTDYLKDDFENYEEIEVTYEKVRNTLNRMKDEEIIFPKNALYFKPLSYQTVLTKIKTKEIYRIMSTFNKLNILTRLALTSEQEVFYLYVQYPFYQFAEVMEILDELDPTRKTYIETKHLMSDAIYSEWALEGFKKSERQEVSSMVAL